MLIVAHNHTIDEKHLRFVMSKELSGVPREIQVVPVGEWNGYYSDQQEKHISFSITPEHIAQMAKNFSAVGHDLVIDYEHQTLSGDVAPAAGWIKQLVDKGQNGLWAVVEWTERALNYLRNKEYRFLSPTFTLDGVDTVTGDRVGALLVNAALTNNPFFTELPAIVSKSPGDTSSPATIFITKEHNMNELLERIRYFLGVPITATAEECMAELNKLIGQIKDSMGADSVQAVNGGSMLQFFKAQKDKVVAAAAKYGEVMTALGLKVEATVEEAKGMIIAGKGTGTVVQTLQTELANLKKQIFDRDFDAVIAKGMQTGRILPAQKADQGWLESQRSWAEKNFASFEEHFTAKAPVIGPLTPIPSTGASEGHVAGISEADRIVAKNMGVTEEQLKKHNK